MMFTSANNPILATFRRWNADARQWADIMVRIDTGGKVKPNTKDVKQVLAACQLGSARLVPFDGGFIVKGPQRYADKLEAAYDHARRVLTRVANLGGTKDE